MSHERDRARGPRKKDTAPSSEASAGVGSALELPPIPRAQQSAAPMFTPAFVAAAAQYSVGVREGMSWPPMMGSATPHMMPNPTTSESRRPASATRPKKQKAPAPSSKRSRARTQTESKPGAVNFGALPEPVVRTPPASTSPRSARGLAMRRKSSIALSPQTLELNAYDDPEFLRMQIEAFEAEEQRKEDEFHLEWESLLRTRAMERQKEWEQQKSQMLKAQERQREEPWIASKERLTFRETEERQRVVAHEHRSRGWIGEQWHRQLFSQLLELHTAIETCETDIVSVNCRRLEALQPSDALGLVRASLIEQEQFEKRCKVQNEEDDLRKELQREFRDELVRLDDIQYLQEEERVKRSVVFFMYQLEVEAFIRRFHCVSEEEEHRLKVINEELDAREDFLQLHNISRRKRVAVLLDRIAQLTKEEKAQRKVVSLCQDLAREQILRRSEFFQQFWQLRGILVLKQQDEWLDILTTEAQTQKREKELEELRWKLKMSEMALSASPVNTSVNSHNPGAVRDEEPPAPMAALGAASSSVASKRESRRSITKALEEPHPKGRESRKSITETGDEPHPQRKASKVSENSQKDGTEHAKRKASNSDGADSAVRRASRKSSATIHVAEKSGSEGSRKTIPLPEKSSSQGSRKSIPLPEKSSSQGSRKSIPLPPKTPDSPGGSSNDSSRSSGQSRRKMSQMSRATDNDSDASSDEGEDNKKSAKSDYSDDSSNKSDHSDSDRNDDDDDDDERNSAHSSAKSDASSKKSAASSKSSRSSGSSRSD
eukprot:NODE_237_length_2637_cov_23.232998_g215_i0.p1 GENE.NODE_237_length_2637_cov_23.232998_g215_i0~~NODE_237_length_2637_cov_23.232998_g215_i0.p1  ORF type:complete len:775 (-),score=146.75 NODE_237_length_2637_cov_23.232998_g215_i0:171-2495(-)